jgi:predicted dehydrogenase
MQSRKTRVAIIGLDMWYTALSLGEAAARREDIELVGIADSDLVRATTIAHRLGVESVTSDLQGLAQDPRVDAVMSFVSPEQNPAICVTAAGAGKNILSLKPMARTLDDGAKIVRAVEESGVKFLPAESLHRVRPYNQELRRWVLEGRLGQLLSATGWFWQGLPQRWPGDPDPGWWVDPTRTFGGAWVDHSIYHIDLLRWLFGEEVVQVSGCKANLKHPEFGVEDYGVATIQFRGGGMATLENTWVAPTGGWHHGLELVGSEGAAAFDSRRGILSAVGKFAPWSGWVEVAPRVIRLEDDELDQFVAMSRDVDQLASVEDAWQNLKVCLAFYEASASGHRVSVQA